MTLSGFSVSTSLTPWIGLPLGLRLVFQTAIVTLTTSGLTGRDVVGIDEVYYGVPEPATMLMLGCLGTGILATRKSRRKR